MCEFYCNKCKVLFCLTKQVIDTTVDRCFKEAFGGGGIHCPCCRDNNSVTVVI